MGNRQTFKTNNTPGSLHRLIVRDERSEADAIDAESATIESNGSVRASARLAADIVRRFQPVINEICFRKVAIPVDLSSIEIFVGTTDGRARAYRGAILLPTPSIVPGTYKQAFPPIAHESAHLIQQNLYGYEEYISRWSEEWEENGEDSYFVKNTIEYEAEQLKKEILAGLRP